MSPFALACLQICHEEGNSLSIQRIRNEALQKLMSGEVKSLVTTTLNGKSATFTVPMSPDKVFAETSWAIRAYDRGVITNTTFDFSLLIY
jgi:hypothetical protein